MTANEPVQLLTVLQAAERLGMKRGWVYLRIKDGSLPVVEVGSGRSRLRIRSDHVQQFIESRTVGTVR